MSLLLHLPDSAATDALGNELAQCAPPSAIVYLYGELGAGKSTLARALLRALGVEGPIKSPTYTLVERYSLAEGEAVHLDLYRIAQSEELDFLGLDELIAQVRLWLVEWPERGAGALPPADLEITLAVEGSGRCVQLQANGEIGEQWIAALEK